MMREESQRDSWSDDTGTWEDFPLGKFLKTGSLPSFFSGVVLLNPPILTLHFGYQYRFGSSLRLVGLNDFAASLLCMNFDSR